MKSSIHVLLASGLLVASSCSGAEDAAAPTSEPVDDQPTPTATSAPIRATPDDELTVVAGEVATTTGDTDLDAPDSTSVPGGAPPPTDTGGESLGPLGDTDLEVETDEGTVQIGDAEVPSSLDSAFPLPEDLVVQLASETPTDLGFSGTTRQSIEQLTESYATELPQAGYTITESQIVEGVLAVFTFEGRDRLGQVAISETPGETGSTVLVTISDGAGQEATVSG